jgi:uncharacterized membrane protein
MSLTRLQPLSVNANADFTFANVTSTYFLGNGYFLTGITTGGTSIVNGNSNVAVSANSNVTIGVAGTSNVVVVTQNTVDVTGNVSANFYTGNGYYLTGITGGTSYSNTNVAAYLPTYTGNVSANYFIGNGSTLTDITGANVVGNVTYAVQSHYANIANSVAGANVSGNVSYAITSNYANTANAVAGTNVSGNVADAVHAYYADVANSVTGANVSGNVTSAVQSHYANIANSVTGANVSGQVSNALIAGTVYTDAQPNITSVGTLSSLTVSGLITATATGIKAANIQDTSGTVTLVTRYGNQVGDIGVYGNITAGTNGSGNVVATYFVGNGYYLTGITGGTSYSNTNVAAYLPTYTGNVAGNYFIGNGSTLTNITGSNVTGYVPNATNANSATTADTVTTNAQPNITSVGILTGLVVSGNITPTANLTYSLGNNTHRFNDLYLSGNTIFLGTQSLSADGNGISITGNLSGSGSELTDINGANVTGQVSNALIAGTVYTTAQPNITSVGTLSGLSVTGLITATGTGIKASNIQDSAGTVTLVTGYASQSGDVGVYGNIVAGTSGSGNITATYFVGNGYYLTGISGGGSYSNTNVSDYLPTYTGNISAGNLSLTGAITDSGQLDIQTTAGSANIVLTPNGSGNVNTPANLTVTGNITGGAISANNTLTIQQVTEKIKVDSSTGSGNYSIDYSQGSTVMLSGLSGNINIVISNVPTTSNISIVTTAVISQGVTAYIPSNVYINNSLQTILWVSGATPTGTASKNEVFSFALLNNSGSWAVLGQSSYYG